MLFATSFSANAAIPEMLGSWSLATGSLSGFVEFDFVPGAPAGDYVLDLHVPAEADKNFLAFGDNDFGATLQVSYNIPADTGIRVGVRTSQTLIDGLTEDKPVIIEARAGNELTESVGFGSGTGIVTLRANESSNGGGATIDSAADLFIAAFLSLGSEPPACTISELGSDDGEALSLTWRGTVNEEVLSNNLSLIDFEREFLTKAVVASEDQPLADAISSLIQQFVTAKVRFPKKGKSLFRIIRSDNMKNNAAIQASSVTLSDLTRDASGNLSFIANSSLPASAFAKNKLTKLNDKGRKDSVSFKANIIPAGSRAIKKHLKKILEKSTKKLPVTIDLTTDDAPLDEGETN